MDYEAIVAFFQGIADWLRSVFPDFTGLGDFLDGFMDALNAVLGKK